MKANRTRYYTGTSAIDVSAREDGYCRIITPDFGRKARLSSQPYTDHPRKSIARRVFEGSEMLCSLAFEDFRGCRYGVFTHREVIASSAIIVALSSLAIALGA